MSKIIFLAGAIAGGLGLSQFPEFSQQYLQRLAGQVDALELVVRDFDATAQRNGLSREAALSQMTGTDFLQDRQADMRNVFLRHAKASDDLFLLRQTPPIKRLMLPHRLGDMQTLQATWADYRPAVPVTFDGLLSALIGFIAGGGLATGLWALVKLPFRRIFA